MHVYVENREFSSSVARHLLKNLLLKERKQNEIKCSIKDKSRTEVWGVTRQQTVCLVGGRACSVSSTSRCWTCGPVQNLSTREVEVKGYWWVQMSLGIAGLRVSWFYVSALRTITANIQHPVGIRVPSFCVRWGLLVYIDLVNWLPSRSRNYTASTTPVLGL